MARANRNKKAQTSLLISLILHVIIALVLGLFLFNSSQEEAEESLAVDIMFPIKRVMPPRRMERREARTNIPDSRIPIKQKAKVRFEPRRFEQADIDLSDEPTSSDISAIVPEVTTSVERVRARPVMPIPRATGADVMKPGASARRSVGGDGPGVGGIGLSSEAGLFETALYWIARNIASQNKTGKEDVVFLIDASGTMADNIAAVARYVSRMVDVFKESELDYTMGVVRFKRILKKNDVKIYEQTTDVNQIKKILRSIKCRGDERTLDAIDVGLTQVKFRNPVDKTFILVTDEAFTPRSDTRRNRRDLTRGQMIREDFKNTVKACQDDGVKVNVLGIDDALHKALAKETNGLWFQIPQQNN